jgi:hypothetical protein
MYTQIFIYIHVYTYMYMYSIYITLTLFSLDILLPAVLPFMNVSLYVHTPIGVSTDVRTLFI